MKNLRLLCAAFMLMLALTMTSLAGDIHTPVATPSTATTQGDISTMVASDSVVEIALNLVQGVLSLF